MDKNMQSIYSAPELCMETLQKHEIYSRVFLNINNAFFFCFPTFFLNHILSHLPSFSSCSSQENPFMLVQLPVSGQQ